MGALNASPTFVAMITKLKIEWDTLAKELGLDLFASKIINQLLAYLRTDIGYP